MRNIKALRQYVIEKHSLCCKYKDFGEILCFHIHSLNMPFNILAKHFKMTLPELAKLISYHINKL